MHEQHLAIIFVGNIIALAASAYYFIKSNNFHANTWGLTALIGVVLGGLSVIAINYNFWIFIILFASYLAGALQLFQQSGYSQLSEYVKGSTAIASCVSFFTLYGCIVCNS